MDKVQPVAAGEIGSAFETIGEYIRRKLGTYPSGHVKCPGCEQPLAPVAIVKGEALGVPTKIGKAWRCGHCRMSATREAEDAGPPALTWADIRGQRSVFLQATDWSQLPDAPEDARLKFALLRQQARDLTSLVSPEAARIVLDELNSFAGLR